MSPIYVESQQEWDAQYRQAIGRSRRYGQQKKVYVHHFLALKTIDVDLAQKWRRQKLILPSNSPTWEMANLGEIKVQDLEQDWRGGFMEEVD